MSTNHDFLDALASGDPTPGGGSAAAMAGAAGAALVAMVARVTIGKKRYAAVEETMQQALVRAEALRSRLQTLIEEDASAFDAVSAAYRLPKASAEEQAARADAVELALKGASLTPLETARLCAEVLTLSEQVATQGNNNALSDAGVSALLAHAGLHGAAWNVAINLADIADAAFADATRAECRRAVAAGDASLQRVCEQVNQGI